MIYILGLYDYLKDKIHDYVFEADYEWSEGPLSFYVAQRRIAKTRRNERRRV